MNISSIPSDSLLGSALRYPLRWIPEGLTVVHGFKSALHAGLWKIMGGIVRAYLAVETEARGIFTQKFFAVAVA